MELDKQNYIMLHQQKYITSDIISTELHYAT